MLVINKIQAYYIPPHHPPHQIDHRNPQTDHIRFHEECIWCCPCRKILCRDYKLQYKEPKSSINTELLNSMNFSKYYLFVLKNSRQVSSDWSEQSGVPSHLNCLSMQSPAAHCHSDVVLHTIKIYSVNLGCMYIFTCIGNSFIKMHSIGS